MLASIVGRPCGEITFVMSQCHGISAALVQSAFAWRRATGEPETCWCKRGVSLVIGLMVGIMCMFASSEWADRATKLRS